MAVDPGMGFSHDITVGYPIYTRDGDHLGEVREIRGSYFKVSAPMQPDYWLPFDTIQSSTGGQVRLNFHKDQLGEHKVANLPAA